MPILFALPNTGLAESLCQPDEKTVFACPVGTKVVSLCEATRPSGGSAALLYRFGRPGKPPELTYPAAGDTPAFRAGSSALAGGGGAWIEFERGQYRYNVYSFWIKGEGEVAGVAVDRDGKRRATLRCRGQAISELGPDFFTAAGIPPSDSDFLP